MRVYSTGKSKKTVSLPNYFRTGVPLMTRDVMPSSVDMVEDVTGVCPIALPQGVEVYRVQQIKFAY